MDDEPTQNENSLERLKLQLVEPDETYKDTFLSGEREIIEASGRKLEQGELEKVWRDVMFQQSLINIVTEKGTQPKQNEYWCINDGQYTGRIQLRQDEYTNLLVDERTRFMSGNVGYVVVPSYRRKGIASFMLKEIIQKAKEKGFKIVTIGCESDNFASIGVIEKAGGKYVDSFVDKSGTSNKYKIELE